MYGRSSIFQHITILSVSALRFLLLSDAPAALKILLSRETCNCFLHSATQVA